MNPWVVTNTLLFAWRNQVAVRTTELWCGILAFAIADNIHSARDAALDWFHGTEGN